ncbi:hypothetical protein D3C76_1175120 [compost metagenome]
MGDDIGFSLGDQIDIVDIAGGGFLAEQRLDGLHDRFGDMLPGELIAVYEQLSKRI